MISGFWTQQVIKVLLSSTSEQNVTSILKTSQKLLNLRKIHSARQTRRQNKNYFERCAPQRLPRSVQSISFQTPMPSSVSQIWISQTSWKIFKNDTPIQKCGRLKNHEILHILASQLRWGVSFCCDCQNHRFENGHSIWNVIKKEKRRFRDLKRHNWWSANCWIVQMCKCTKLAYCKRSGISAHFQSWKRCASSSRASNVSRNKQKSSWLKRFSRLKLCRLCLFCACRLICLWICCSAVCLFVFVHPSEVNCVSRFVFLFLLRLSSVLSCLSEYLSCLCVFICLVLCFSVCLSLCLSVLFFCVCLPVCLFFLSVLFLNVIYFSVCLSAFVDLSVNLFSCVSFVCGRLSVFARVSVWLHSSSFTRNTLEKSLAAVDAGEIFCTKFDSAVYYDLWSFDQAWVFLSDCQVHLAKWKRSSFSIWSWQHRKKSHSDNQWILKQNLPNFPGYLLKR